MVTLSSVSFLQECTSSYLYKPGKEKDSLAHFPAELNQFLLNGLYRKCSMGEGMGARNANRPLASGARRLPGLLGKVFPPPCVAFCICGTLQSIGPHNSML